MTQKQPMNGKEPSPQMERLITWVISGLGVVLLISGVVGYVSRAPSIAGGKTAAPVPMSQAYPESPTSPILLITVGSLRGDIWQQVHLTPSLAPQFFKLAKNSTYFSGAIAASADSLPGTVSVLTGAYPSQHQYYWRPWDKLPNGKSLPESRATSMKSALRLPPEWTPHFESHAWCQDWLLFRSDVLKRPWRGFSISKGPKDPAKDDVIEPRTPELVSMFAKHLRTNSAPLQTLWFHFDDLDYPYVLDREKVQARMGGDRAPTAKQLRSSKFVGGALAKAGEGAKNSRLARALYWAGVQKWDENLGLLITALKNANLYDQTTIILVGTSGAAVGNRDEKLQKDSTAVSNLRVPLLVKEANQKEGASKDFAVSTTAVAPTLREIAGYGRDDTFPSASLVPYLRGQKGSPLVLSELFEGDFRRLTVTQTPWAGECHHRLQTEKGEEFFCYLMDLKEDPDGIKRLSWETLKDAEQKKLVQLKDAALAVLKPSGDPFSLVRTEN